MMPARALSLAHPTLIARSVELMDESPRTLAALDAVLGLPGDEDQVRLTDGVPSVPRLARVTPARAESPISPDTLYIVAGGGGRLGQAMTRFLIDRGARHLLLVGRSAIPSFSHRGITARSLALDLTAADAAARLKAAIDRPLGGVIHAAGVADGRTETGRCLLTNSCRRVSVHGVGRAQVGALVRSAMWFLHPARR